MFLNFFYQLKNHGIPVSPTAFLSLHKALSLGLINSLDEFYTASRALLVKSERYFDLYDQIFAAYFKGADLPNEESLAIDDMAAALLEEWLRDPKTITSYFGIDENALRRLTPEALLEYFKKILEEQTERHDGGNRWIGTGGTSPVGHSGFHPGGMRVGGVSRGKSAVKVALDRRYRDYSLQGPLTQALVGEALKRLRHMRPAGPKDRVNVDSTIYQTMKNGGEIEIIFDRALKDRLKVILLIDNGGWSMDPYVTIVQTLFSYASAQFKELKTYFFHNTIYETVWQDPARYKKPKPIRDFIKLDPETRIIVVGDASMAPYELMARDGSIYISDRAGRPSVECLRYITKTFRHTIWLNPVRENHWPYTQTIDIIRKIFPMVELSIDGLEKAVTLLMEK